MTPREFVGVYGRVVPITQPYSPVARLVIPSDDDRYLLTFWSVDGQVSIYAGADAEGQGSGRIFTPGTPPITFDFAHHGSLPGSAWTVVGSGGSGNITYLVGRMVAPPLPDVIRTGGYRGEKAVVGRRTIDGGIRPGVPAQPASAGTDPVVTADVARGILFRRRH